MSFQAMTWAIDQDVSSPSARCVLMSIANYANADWVAWPKHETIAKEGVQSVDSVQRRMPELVDGGILRRIKLKRFGRRIHDFYILAPSPFFVASIEEIRPLLPSSCDVMDDGERAAADCGSVDADATLAPADEPQDHAAADCGSVQNPTLPQSADDAAADCGSHKEPVKEPKTNPKPLSEDERGFSKKSIEEEKTEKRWERFRTAGYPDGLIDIIGARREFGKLSEDDQEAAIVGIPAYKDYCRRRDQKNPKPAHLYLRKKVWSGLSAMAAVDGAPRVTSHSPHSEAGMALLALASIAGHSLFRLPNGNISYVNPVTPQLLALANVAPLPPSEWIDCEIGDQHFAAWRDLIYRVFAGRTLRAMHRYRVPWAWPPTVDGRIYSGTAPPGELSDADAQALAVM